MILRRNFLLSAASGAAFLPGSAIASPGKPVRVIVPLPAGGATDALARLVTEKVRPRYAPTMVVDNKPGAGGRIGVEMVKNGPSDGSLLLFTPDFPLTLFPSIYHNMPYIPGDFVPVASCGVTSMALAAGPGLPETVRSIADLVAWSRANPKAATYASPAAGSTPHFAAMMFARAAQLELLHVPYKGGAPAIQDLLGGQVPLSINPVGEVLQHVKTGKLRVLATTGPTRSRFLPQAPTMVEAGYKDVVVQSWLGMFAPGATPLALVDRLNSAIQDVIQDAEVVEAFARIGFEPAAPATPAQFARVVRRDVERWAGVVKATGFKADQ